jgi:hypothetical protein
MADFDSSHWAWRQRILIEGTPGIARVNADAPLYRGSFNHLADVRIVRDGKEVPYYLEDSFNRTELKDVAATVLNKSVVAGQGLQLTLDAGRAAQHDRVDIDSPLRDYRQRVKIETSGDNVQWDLVRDDGYIASVSSTDRPLVSPSVSYPVSARRYVRITIFGWLDPKAVNSARLAYFPRPKQVRQTYTFPAPPARSDDTKAKTTTLTLNIGYSGLPHDQVSLDVSPGYFHRAVRVETSDNAKDWTYIGQDTISRNMNGEEWLSVSYPEQWDRYVRVIVDNQDDQPLGVPRMSLQSRVRSFLCPAGTRGDYWLYYGNPQSVKPSYDLMFIVPATAEGKGVLAPLGPQEANPTYRPVPAPQKPISDRYPALLYTILGVAIAAMGYATIRLLLRLKVDK